MQRTHEIDWFAPWRGNETLSTDTRGRAAGWEAVVRAVDRIAPADRWRESVAAKLHQAVGEHHALVFTCPLNQPERGSFAVSPAACRPLGDRVMGEHMPRLEQSGEGWRRLYRRCGVVCPVMDALAGVPVAESLRRDLLEPAGIAGYLCAFFVTPREDLAGWIVVATLRPEPEVLAEIAAPLQVIARRAAQTLTAALDIAESCGASFPEPAFRDEAS